MCFNWTHARRCNLGVGFFVSLTHRIIVWELDLFRVQTCIQLLDSDHFILACLHQLNSTVDRMFYFFFRFFSPLPLNKGLFVCPKSEGKVLILILFWYYFVDPIMFSFTKCVYFTGKYEKKELSHQSNSMSDFGAKKRENRLKSDKIMSPTNIFISCFLRRRAEKGEKFTESPSSQQYFTSKQTTGSAKKKRGVVYQLPNSS